MVEWHVAEESPTPSRQPTAPHPWRQPGLMALLGVLFISSIGGIVAWRTYQQNQLLYRDLTAVILAESNAQAFGLTREVDRWADPAAPSAWLTNYRRLYSNLPQQAWPPASVAPRLLTTTLDPTTNIATVTLAWEGASTVTERRAYRLIDGQWHRTPLPLAPDTEWQHLRSDHFLFMAHPPELAQGEPLLTALESTYRHAVQTWPADLFPSSPVLVIVRVEPRELAPLLMGGNPENREIYLNVPELGAADPTLPLSPLRQREVRTAVSMLYLQMRPLLDDLLWRVTSGRDWNGPPDPARERMGRVLRLLPTLTAYESLLSDEEQAALQAQWRGELQQQWLSPFDYTFLAPEDGEIPIGDYALWDSSFQLLMAYLYAEQGITAGDLATAIAAHPDWEFQQHLTTLSGHSRKLLEERLYEFVME